MPIFLKYVSLKLVAPSGPVQARNEIALPFSLPFTADSDSSHLCFESLLGLILDSSPLVLVNVTVLVSWGAFCVEMVCLFCTAVTVLLRYTCTLAYIQALCMYNYTVIHSLLTLQRGVMGTARMLHALTHSSISPQVREQM